MTTVRLALVALALWALPAASAPDAAPATAARWPPKPFSADLVMTPAKGRGGAQEGSGPAKARIYASKGRIRMELSASGNDMVTLMDMGTQKSFMLMPAQKMAMDMSHAMQGAMAQQRGAMSPERFAASGGNPCEASKDADPKRTCRKVGSEKANGRATTRWEVKDEKGQASTLWIDETLLTMVRYQDADGSTVDMQNLKEGPQADTLFEVPRDYQQMQMPQGPQGQGPAAPMGAGKRK